MITNSITFDKNKSNRNKEGEKNENLMKQREKAIKQRTGIMKRNNT